MKYITLFIAVLALAACGKKADPTHNLSADESRRAKINASAFFDGEHAVVKEDGTLGKAQGSFSECRPQDSNSNGMVTCTGVVPANTPNGWATITRYCGYQEGGVQGCSDKDTQ